MKAASVTFRLEFATRKDENANVHIGFCPVLKLYSQGNTPEEAEAAIVDAAQLFIVTCYERDSLHKVLRSRGMKKASIPMQLHGTERDGTQFIHIEGYDNQFERDVPIMLPINVEAVTACVP